MYYVLGAILVLVIIWLVYHTTRLQFFPSEPFLIQGGGMSPRENILDSDYKPEYFDNIPVILNSDDAALTHDLDSDYVSSREYMGACTTKRRRGGFLTCARGMPSCGNTAIGLLYYDVMGLSNPPPSADDCEFIGYNGYSYKQPC